MGEGNENLIKPSPAINLVRCIKETDVSRTFSFLIIRDVIYENFSRRWREVGCYTKTKGPRVLS
jgi:hypothetical protein